MNAAKGGRATARKHGPEFCTARSSQGGKAVRDRYGVEFYKTIARMRKRSGPKPKFKPN